MNLESLLFLSIPAALVAFKLATLVLATVWALRSAVGPHGLELPGQHQLVPVRSRAPRI